MFTRSEAGSLARISADLESSAAANIAARHGLNWKLQASGEISTVVAEMDFDLAAPITDALVESARTTAGRYITERELDALKIAFCEWHSVHQAWNIDPGRVLVSHDIYSALVFVLNRLTVHGDPVGLVGPSYPGLAQSIEESGRRVLIIPARPMPEGLDVDETALRDFLSIPRRVLVLSHPNNPTGLPLSHRSREVLASAVAASEATVVSDEVFAPLTLTPARHRPLASDGALAAHTITVTGASKGWGLSGAKCAQVVVPRELGGRLGRQERAQWPDISRMGVVASTAAWQHGNDWLVHLRAHLARLRNDLVDGLRGAAVDVVEPQSGYVAWLDFAPLTGDQDAADVIARATGVHLAAGPRFFGEHRHARVSFATSRGVLDEIIRRIAAIHTGQLNGKNHRAC